MGIIVQKFGGSSVENTEKLFKLCTHIIREYNNRNQVVVVVSAQGKTTDRLISESREIDDVRNLREYDMLISTGEQITIAKLSMVLNKLGYKAKSFCGWQLPIITDSMHSNANIRYINNEKIKKELNSNYIVIVAGFQGIDEEGNITTLGRGGSDTTAVALGASLNADRVEIYTDVDGVYTADPRIERNATKIEKISYDEMLQMSNNGAKVLHSKCVEIGKKSKIPIIVKSTFQENSIGTIVTE